MANKLIRGLTVEIGGDTTKLGEALKNVESKSKNLSGELNAINRLLKLDPTNTELLAQKQQVLSEAISATREKLAALKEAEKQVQEQFARGEISGDQYRKFQREIAATEAKLKEYEDSAKETDEALKNLAKGTKTAEQRTRELSERSGVAAKDLDNLKEKASDAASKGLKVVTVAAAAAVAALTAAAEATREYRTNMAKLNVAFTDNGHSAAEAQEAYQELVGVLGESDQAVEAANHLAKLTDNARDLATWTGDILPGVFATFGDSLPIEGLTEAANETAKVGQVTGPLADALNWAGVSEDKFNESLAACSDEQERQALITGTLSRLYKGATDQYKRTNAEVIRANKANDAWTASLAKTGKTMEPIVTDVKELGVELLQSAEQPVQRLTKYIRSTLLPTLEKASKWALKNGPQLIGVATGLTTAMAAYKTGALAAKVVTSDLTKVVLGAEKAQKLLNLAQAATPWGLAVAGAAAVVAGLAVYSAAMREAKEPVDHLTESERELVESSMDAAKALQEQADTTKDRLDGISSQFDNVAGLADKLFELADASGHVQEADRSHAEVLLNLLNDALGTEYTMVNGQIQAYAELQKGIDDTISAKRAEAMLSAYKSDYEESLKAQAEACRAASAAYKDYQAQLQEVTGLEDDLAKARKAYVDSNYMMSDLELIRIQTELDAARKALNEKTDAWKQLSSAALTHSSNIRKYQDALTAAQERNSDKVCSILQDEAGEYSKWSSAVNSSTSEALDALGQAAMEAANRAQKFRSNFESGVGGYTSSMVREAEKANTKLWAAFAETPDKALKFGQDVGDGMVKGMESKRKSVYDTAESIANGMFRRLRAVTQTHSPSRRMEGVFRDIWAGAEVGTEKSEKPILAHTQDLAEKLLNIDAAARMPALALQRITQQDQAARAAAYQAAFAVPGTPLGDLSAKLDLILVAIDRGQIIALDGDQIVGGTVDRVNARLGLISTENSRNVR